MFCLLTMAMGQISVDSGFRGMKEHNGTELDLIEEGERVEVQLRNKRPG